MDGCCDNGFFIDLLNAEVLPALGCTEPIAVALAVAKARETLLHAPRQIEVLVSGNIYKNGMGVGVPGTGITGLAIAAALGAVEGSSSDGLELLKNVNEASVTRARVLVDQKRVVIKIKKDAPILYVEAILTDDDNNCATVVICGRHSNIIKVMLNGRLLLESGTVEDFMPTPLNHSHSEGVPGLTVENIYNFVLRVSFSEIGFILKSAELNKIISAEGLKNDYGLMVGKKIWEKIKSGLLCPDILTVSMAATAAATDARMAGSKLAVMSNSGSGNQGITATLPVVAVAEKLGATREQLARALVLSHLVAIHIKAHLGRLSALCGCVVAAAGAGCGVALLIGGGYDSMVNTIKNMVGNVTGMICDGAKVGCALKVSSGVSSAIQSALLGTDGIVIPSNNGIIDDDIEKTIRNLGLVGSQGMTQTDELMLKIMVDKAK